MSARKLCMKFASFNVNSIRSRLHQLQALVETHNPEFIGLQETKVEDSQFPAEAIAQLGYEVAFTGQKTHYGVALLAKQPFKSVTKGFAGDTADAQKRFIGGQFELPDGTPLSVYNGYFPQGESREHPVKFPAKEKFFADLHAHLKTHHRPSDAIVLMGDMNVAPHDSDIGIGEDNRKRWLKSGKCSFLPEEREWLHNLLQWGFKDSFRVCYPNDDQRFSWFDYRSRGFERQPKRGLRIDFVLATAALADKCAEVQIDYAIRAMNKPSDHCPVIGEFTLGHL